VQTKKQKLVAVVLTIASFFCFVHGAFAFEILPDPLQSGIDTSAYYMVDGAERIQIPLSCPNFNGGNVAYTVFYAQSVSGTSTSEVYLNGIEATGYQVNENATTTGTYQVGSGQSNRVIASWSSPVYCNGRTANFLWYEVSGTTQKIYMNSGGGLARASLYPVVIDKSTHSSLVPANSYQSLGFGVYGSEATTSSSGGSNSTTTYELITGNPDSIDELKQVIEILGAAAVFALFFFATALFLSI